MVPTAVEWNLRSVYDGQKRHILPGDGEKSAKGMTFGCKRVMNGRDSDHRARQMLKNILLLI